MKFAAMVSAAALAAVTNADMCNSTSLLELLNLPETRTCADKSGYMMASLKTPTNAQLGVMCTDHACQFVLSQIKNIAPAECTLNTFSLYADMINPLTVYCNGNSSLAGSPVTPNVTMESNNTTSETTTSKVTGSKIPTTSNDHTQTLTDDTPAPDTTDNTMLGSTDDITLLDDTTPDATTPDAATNDTTHTSISTTPAPDTLDDASAKTTSGATSVSITAVSAGVFMVAMATAVL